MQEKDSEDESDFIGFSPIKDKVTSDSDIEQANSLAKQLHVYKPGIEFVPGSKLEVLDARDNKWYLCKVVEVDWGELDILVHYERWSVRFDEWLKMDSTRIRPVCLATQRRESKRIFRMGERVLAFWAPDCKMYPAQITRHISEDFWNVLFFDGFTKALRTSQIKKICRKSPEADGLKPARISVRASSQSGSNVSEDEEISVSSSISDQHKRNIFNVEILKEKRKTIRKPDVEELFQSLKKRKRSETVSDGEEEPFNSKERPPKKKCIKDPPHSLKMNRNNTPPPEEPQEAPPLPFKAASEESTSHPKPEPPKGLSHFEVELEEGWKKICTRRSSASGSGKWDVYYLSGDLKRLKTRQDIAKQLIDHPDSTLDQFQMDFSVRTAWLDYEKQEKDQSSNPSFKEGALTVSPSEEKNSTIKIKSEEDQDATKKNHVDLSLVKIEEEEEEENQSDDIAVNTEEEKEEETQLMSIKDESEIDGESRKASFPGNENIECVKLSDKVPLAKEIDQKGFANVKPLKKNPPVGEPTLPLDQIEFKKTASASTSLSTPRTRMRASIFRRDPTLNTSAFSPADATHLCPKKGCEKSFRKESLLQMHMKHYHPGLLKRKSLQAPNVADLAYARTVGDHLDVEPLSSSSLGFSSGSFSQEKLSKSSDKKSKTFLGFENKNFSRDSNKEVALDLSISDLDEDDLDSEFDAEDEEEEVDEAFSEVKDKVIPVGIDPDYVPICVQKDRRPVRLEEKSKRKSRKSEDAEDDLGDSWNEPCDTENEDDAIIHCRCGSKEEDGLMLQCDVCLCWQHSNCYNIDNENQVPDKYICSLCENPKGQRSSMKFRHHQEWLKEGKLPRFSFSGSDDGMKLESSIRKGHELTANILQLSPLLHSLRLKLRISKNEDHPKFVMWFKKWVEVKDEFDKDDKEVFEVPNVPELMSAFQQPSSLQTEPPPNSLIGPSQSFDADKYSNNQPTQAKDTMKLDKDAPLQSSTPLPTQEAFNSPHSADPNSNPVPEESSDKKKLQEAICDVEIPSEKPSEHKNLSEELKIEEDSKLIEAPKSIAQEDSKLKGDRDSSMGEVEAAADIDEAPAKPKSESPHSSVPDVLPTIDSKYPPTDSTRVALDDSAMDLEFDDDFLSTQTDLEQFVKHASSLAPLVTPTDTLPTIAPIIPETERIEPIKCKLNLLGHIESFQDKIFNRFDYFEKQIQALETEMGLTSRFSKEEEELFSSQSDENRDPVTLQARSLVKLVLKDLDAVRRMTEYTAP